MESFAALLDGFDVALTPTNLFYCLLGVLWGTIVGVLPGLGPLAGMTLLLPLTFRLEPAAAIIMLAGIFYGAIFGSSTTSILVRIPGSASAIVLCLDGYAMARKGRAGPALVIAAVASWVGGTLSIVGLMLFAPPLARMMLAVGPAAEFTLMVLALLVVSFVSTSPPLKTLAMVLFGLVIATVGLDPITAYPRFTFGSLQLADGVSFVAMALGLFGLSEILINLEKMAEYRPIRPTLRSLIPKASDLREAAPAIGRGSLIGFFFGFIPGISHVISTFVSYAVERRLSNEPQEFGQGKVQGVAGPEAANNATTGSCMIPLLILGIPAIPATAILLSALMIHGINPGPQLLQERPDVFWGLIASMYIGNLILLMLNLPMVGLFVNLLRVPYHYLAPGVLLVAIIGVYSVSASALDVGIMVVFGLLGYVLRKFDFDVAPLLLAVILGNAIEVALRRSLTISDGSYSIFLEGAAAKVLVFAVLVLGFAQAASRLFLRRPPTPGGEPTHRNGSDP